MEFTPEETPAPAPAPAPEPAPAQEPSTEFVQEPTTEFVPEPAPAPAAEPVVAPAPEPKPEPQPKPKAKPKKKKKAPVVVVADDEEESDEDAAEDKDSESDKDKKDSTGKKPYGTVGVSFVAGFNLLTDVDKSGNSESVDLDFFSPVILLELDFMLGSKFGLLFGTGFMYASTGDPNMGWLDINQRYNENQFGNIFMMPLYGGVKIHLGDTGKLHPYGKVDLGYTFMWADDPILTPIGSSYYGYYDVSESYAYGGFLWGFAFGIENPMGALLEAGIMMYDGGIYTRYRYNGYWNTYDSEMDFMFVNVKFGIRF